MKGKNRSQDIPTRGIKRVFQSRHRAALIITIIILVVVWLIYIVDSHLANVLTHSELYWRDRRIEWHAKLRKFFRGQDTQIANSDIVLILIDDATIKEYGFPPSRESEAALVNALSHYKPKVIAFDLTFERERDKEFDPVLAELSKESGNVIYAIRMEEPKPDATIYELNLNDGLPNLPERFALHPSFIGDNLDENYTPSHLPYPGLLETARYLGHIEAVPDLDGRIRRIPLLFKSGDRYYPALSLAAVCAFKGISFDSILVDLGKHLVLDDGKGWRREIPIDEEGQMWVNYFGDERSFDGHSFYIICEDWSRDIPRLPLQEYFEGKLILIGSGGEGADYTSTPFSSKFPGVGVHATLIDNILQNDFIHDAGWGFNALALLFFTGLMVISQIYSYRSDSHRPQTIYTRLTAIAIGIFLGFIIINFVVFYAGGILLNFALPLVAMSLAFFVAMEVRLAEVPELHPFLYLLFSIFSEIGEGVTSRVKPIVLDENEIELDEKDFRKPLLEDLYRGRKQIDILKTFSEGKSGATVLEIGYDNRDIESYHVAKLGPKEEIIQEHSNWEAIEHLTNDVFAPVERSVTVGDMGAISYKHARQFGGGRPTAKTMTLAELIDRCFQKENIRHAVEVVEFVTDRLGNSLHRSTSERPWKLSKIYFRLFNLMLPPDASCKVDKVEYDENLITLSSNVHRENDVDVLDVKEFMQQVNDPDRSDKLKLEPFALHGLRFHAWKKGKLELSHQDYRVRIRVSLPSTELDKIKKVRNIGGREFNLIQPELINTRLDYFLKQLIHAVGVDIHRAKVEIDAHVFPNPLYYYSKFLWKGGYSIYKRLSWMHGDLNLGNVILYLDANGQPSSPKLIDYAKTGANQPTCFDYAKLETELKTHVLSKHITLDELIELEQELLAVVKSAVMTGQWQSANTIGNNLTDNVALAFRLISCIRKAAYKHYDDPIHLSSFTYDYLMNLFFYSLTTLKFDATSPEANDGNVRPRLFAFTAAAIACEELIKLG